MSRNIVNNYILIFRVCQSSTHSQRNRPTINQVIPHLLFPTWLIVVGIHNHRSSYTMVSFLLRNTITRWCARQREIGSMFFSEKPVSLNDSQSHNVSSFYALTFAVTYTIQHQFALNWVNSSRFEVDKLSEPLLTCLAWALVLWWLVDVKVSTADRIFLYRLEENVCYE